MTQPPPDPRLRRLPVRRAPRYGVFTATGAVVGMLVALVLTLLSGPGDEYSSGSVLGYLAVALGAFGALLGALVGVLAGIRAGRRR